MILGIGNDKIDIRRIEATLDRFGERFLVRVFTDLERRRAGRRADLPNGAASALAKRFAAKEAAAKALGTGFRRGVFWRDLAVSNLPSGQPVMAFSGGAAERLKALLPPGMVARIHVTMTDDYPWAEAVVIVEAVAAD